MSQLQSIIESVAPFAQIYAQKYGYNIASICIAQALKESYKGEGKGYNGLSGLAYKYNNYHGIKNYPKWKGKTVNLKTGEEYQPGIVTKINSNFCVFNNLEDGIEQYFRFLELNPRYKNVKPCKTPESYIAALKLAGYATDSEYIKGVLNYVYKHNLASYDNFEKVCMQQANQPYQIGQTYTLDSNLHIRCEPFGEKMKFECISIDARMHSKFDDYGNAILLKGTRVTCKAVKELTDSVWILIPSGWICAKENDKFYIV